MNIRIYFEIIDSFLCPHIIMISRFVFISLYLFIYVFIRVNTKRVYVYDDDSTSSPRPSEPYQCIHSEYASSHCASIIIGVVIFITVINVVINFQLKRFVHIFICSNECVAFTYYYVVRRETPIVL